MHAICSFRIFLTSTHLHPYCGSPLGVESLHDYLCFFTYSFLLEELKWCIDLSLIVLLFLLTCRDWPLIFFLIMCFWLLGEWVPVLIWLSKELSLFSRPTKEVISWTFFMHRGQMVFRARYFMKCTHSILLIAFWIFYYYFLSMFDLSDLSCISYY